VNEGRSSGRIGGDGGEGPCKVGEPSIVATARLLPQSLVACVRTACQCSSSCDVEGML